MLYFHGYCLSLINHLRPLTGAIASAGKLSPAASRCFSSNRRRSGGRGNAPDAGSDGNSDPTVQPGRGPRRRESEEREENGERRRRPSERGSQRSIQLSTISIADAEVLQAAKRRGMEISEPVVACISDLTFKFTGSCWGFWGHPKYNGVRFAACIIFVGLMLITVQLFMPLR